MPRYKVTLEYDGAPFQGWQWQDHGPSVQGAMEAAAEALNGEPTQVYGSGRTDSGVHALAQVAHLDLIKNLRPDKVRDALNFHLKAHPVTVLEAESVSDDFHARFDAVERRYLYRLIDRRPKLALERGRVWPMHMAAQSLVGQHDFTTFRDTQCQAKSPVKTVDMIRVLRVGAEIHIQFRARSFLHKQVRSFVGSLAEVGRGQWTRRDLEAALKARARTACGPVAPPEGLYLVGA